MTTLTVRTRPHVDWNEPISFHRLPAGGVVHVWARLSPAGLPAGTDTLTLAQFLLAGDWTLCGRRSPASAHGGITDFDDNELCRRCWTATPVEQQHLLFEHPSPQPDDDNGNR